MGRGGEGSKANDADRPLLVAMYCLPAMGHFLPLCSLAGELVRRGHRVQFHIYDTFREEMEPKTNAAGAKFCPLTTTYSGMSPSATRKKVEKNGKNLVALVDETIPLLVEAWQQQRPDLVVVDFLSSAGLHAARKLGLPLVINVPGPTEILRHIRRLPDPSTAVTIMGITLMGIKWSPLRILSHFPTPLAIFFGGLRSTADSSLVLINSFRGLEPPGLIPHNWILTGPLLLPSAKILSGMEASHPELAAWMDEAAHESRPVVYVTTGSLVALSKWEVETLYAGLTLSGCRVVWSLHRDSMQHLPSLWNRSRFWIASWLPQPAILHHAATKVCITHCGWGGTLEVISAAVPVCALPFKADQPINAATLVNAGAAVMLPMTRTRGLTASSMQTDHFREGDFTAGSVAAAIRRVIEEPSFKEAAVALQKQASFSKGLQVAGDCMEWVAWNDQQRSMWDNPVIRRSTGDWTELLLWPSLGLGAAAAVLFVASRVSSHFFSARA